MLFKIWIYTQTLKSIFNLYKNSNRVDVGDAYGIRTHEAAVKGRCLNHLTNAPYLY